MRVFIIIFTVAAALIGLLFTLRSSRNTGTPSPEVLERAKERARAQAAREKDD